MIVEFLSECSGDSCQIQPRKILFILVHCLRHLKKFKINCVVMYYIFIDNLISPKVS